jgi:hypothetical protein
MRWWLPQVRGADLSWRGVQVGINTIRLEGKFPPDVFFDLADEFGLAVMVGWACCDAWQHWDAWGPDQCGPNAGRRGGPAR